MTIIVIKEEFAICKLADLVQTGSYGRICFYAQTNDEISLVCPTENIPQNATAVDAGWRAFRFAGKLDFSLVGILAKAASLLAAESIPIFAVSTFDTDYVLIKSDKFERALQILRVNGYEIKNENHAV